MSIIGKITKKTFQRMGKDLIDRGFYCSTASVYPVVRTKNQSGQFVETFPAPYPLITNVSCAIAPLTFASPTKSDERRKQKVVFEQSLLHVSFPVYYSQIKMDDMIEVDGIQYRIRGVEFGSFKLFSRLQVERLGQIDGD